MQPEPDTLYRIEPTQISSLDGDLADLVADVASASAALAGQLPAPAAASLAELMRLMNCYYSNLIEGHNTRPRDIERALNDDLDDDTRRRHLQLEARAHVRVQREIDRQALRGNLPEPASAPFICWLHEEFYRDAAEDLLTIDESRGAILMQPGRFRQRAEEDSVVGQHQPPSSARVEAFMDRFAERYKTQGAGSAKQIVNMAIAHHRFNYIHPFPDGNGRVSRLMSHAMALRAGIGAHGLWSISRGLARGLRSRLEYRQMMDAADSPRQHDTDGRGNLSERALHEFVSWFLRVALDQLRFMSQLLDLQSLSGRLERYIREESDLRSETVHIVRQALHHAEMRRSDAARATGLGERAGRDALRSLLGHGLLVSRSAKGPVSLHFPLRVAERLFPRLFVAEA